jgi:threonine synthase
LVQGDFDDAQELVKKAFDDEAFRQDVHLGAINSINWARILAQITYYFYAWLRLTAGHKTKGEAINFAVPTGNFGDIFAGYMAKKMGLPIDKLVVCTNENQVLHQFFQSGIYHKAPVISTISPSMDISVSSNLERYLYYLSGEEPEILKSWMEQFENTGRLRLPKNLLHKAQQEFLSCSVNKQEAIDTMREAYTKESYLMCPHTATAAHAAMKLRLKNTHTVVLSTAHPAKFDEALALAFPTETIPARPIQLEELFVLPTRKILLPTIVCAVKNYILSRLQKPTPLSSKSDCSPNSGPSSSARNKATSASSLDLDSTKRTNWLMIGSFAGIMYMMFSYWRSRRS